jgi:hypothetical protein
VHAVHRSANTLVLLLNVKTQPNAVEAELINADAKLITAAIVLSNSEA